MKYYKVIKDNDFVGVGTSYDLREYQTKHGILIIADDNTAQYIQINDKLYRDDWFKSLTTNAVEYETARVSVVEEGEYLQLFDAVKKGEEISIATEDDGSYNQEEPVAVDEEENVTIEYLKAQKIKEMSFLCSQAIFKGFDVELSDGKVHHFSLTVQDQLNLITLSALASTGESRIPYHADGELCEYFPLNDIGLIIKSATELKTYHTTYYNSLKLYIQSLDNKELIASVSYGTDIPDEYKSDVLIALLSNKQ